LSLIALVTLVFLALIIGWIGLVFAATWRQVEREQAALPRPRRDF
jgi:hypothetical protein